MTSTVVPGLLDGQLTRRSECDFGFFFVPTFVGDTVASNVDVPSDC